FATLWGTIFPVLSEWVRGVKITVGPPFFNRVNAPLAIALLLLMGIGPLVAWRRASVRNLMETFLAPSVFGLAAGAAAFAAGMKSLSALLVVSFSAFVLFTVVAEFHRGAQARRSMVGEGYGAALRGLLRKNQRRYGGYIIHVGVVFMFLGVTMSSVYRVEELHTIKKGEEFAIGSYTLRYVDSGSAEDEHVARLIATLNVFEDGQQIAVLEPEKRFYKRPEQPATEVAFRSTMRDDLYVILGGIEKDGTATFQAYVNPLVWWLWFGGVVLILGTAVAAFPARRAVARERARVDAAAARERVG
ncbi:MAG: cytochrome c-type biogenesis CcmF C-terminal domain-containing protein, partial [Candidatus Binatia bacterium]